ncbi:MAG: hypothetical protein IT564_11990 [Rhodospirillales bacterium]|nr:hypothetical protein [Rhodospirillales bacterium]
MTPQTEIALTPLTRIPGWSLAAPRPEPIRDLRVWMAAATVHVIVTYREATLVAMTDERLVA